jgi:hypothetical protein
LGPVREPVNDAVREYALFARSDAQLSNDPPMV